MDVSEIARLAKLLQSLKLAEQMANRANASHSRGSSSNGSDDHLLEASMFFNAADVLRHVESIEPNRAALKRELKIIMRLHMSGLEQGDNVADILQFLMLCGKYRIKETENCSVSDISFANLLWAFPDFGFYQMKKHPEFKFPWSDVITKEYPTFKVLYHNPGLLGMMPKGRKYGGLAKALVFLAYTVSVRVKDIDVCIAMSRAIYNSSLASDERRKKWFPNLGITEADCVVWSDIFNRKFPKHTEIFKLFGQTA